MSNIYVGWLYANLSEYDELKELGVYGPMVFQYDEGLITRALGKNGTITHCLCNEKTMKKLQERYTPLWLAKYPHIDRYDVCHIYPVWSKVDKGKLGFERSSKY